MNFTILVFQICVCRKSQRTRRGREVVDPQSERMSQHSQCRKPHRAQSSYHTHGDQPLIRTGFHCSRNYPTQNTLPIPPRAFPIVCNSSSYVGFPLFYILLDNFQRSPHSRRHLDKMLNLWQTLNFDL